MLRAVAVVQRHDVVRANRHAFSFLSSNKKEPASLLYVDEPAEATLPPTRATPLQRLLSPPPLLSIFPARSLVGGPSFTMHCMRICLQTSHVARMARGRTALPTHQTGLWRASGRGESQRECRLCVPLCHAPGPIGRDLELAYRGGWGPGRFTGAGICRFASRLQAYLLRAPSAVSATSYPYIQSALCGACSRVLAACRLPSPAIGSGMPRSCAVFSRGELSRPRGRAYPTPMLQLGKAPGRNGQAIPNGRFWLARLLN
ncbi:hypothetical protein ACCO45_006001 [Purpureocillium lilacinum]|uniref:Uncharacterized protein n=1 Tax=Purpureocillium lilacinum TaxID=33203 RepID=A0ACC4DZC5_PURLI